jgi:predicted lipoprotein with Yx(FWY)xxD motif
VRDSALGKILSDTAGMTLYTFKNDIPGSGKSACAGGCATTWPPLTTSATTIAAPVGVTGALATIARDDGTKQVTYQGRPLYHYAADKAPGDTTGEGVGGVWSAVKLQPSGDATPTAADGYRY